MKKHSRNLKNLSSQFMAESVKSDYSYNFEWLSRPIIQYPQDIVATQEIIWKVKPDLIIETGIAHGGSIVFSASMLALLDYCDAVNDGMMLDPRKPKRKVIGVDIYIPDDLKDRLFSHGKISDRLVLINQSSINLQTVEEIKSIIDPCREVLILLDSFHTHEHVLKELNMYSPLVGKGQYIICGDTIVEDIPVQKHRAIPWGPGNSPKTALRQFLKENDRFKIDHGIDKKLLFTNNPDGYLKCFKD